MAWTIFAWILIFNTLLAIYIAWGIKARNIRKAGSQELMWMLLALSVWAFGYAMIIFSTPLEVKHFWIKVENIGIVITPVTWFLFASTYTKLDKWITKTVKFLFFIIPTVTLSLLFSERWFYLYYLSAKPYADNIGPLTIEPGAWYMVQAVQSYLLLAIGVLFMLWHLILFRDIYQKRILTMLGALAAPVALNTFYQTGAAWFPARHIPVDLTPIAFTLTAWLINLAIYGHDLFEMNPIARQIVSENIDKMVMVIDEKDRILEANRIALDFLGRKEKDTLGKIFLELFAAHPQLATHYQNEDVGNSTFLLTSDNQRTLNITIVPVYNRFGNLEGRVIIADDITEERK